MELSGNLHRFADFIQSRQRETGAWRGTVTGGSTTGNAAGSAGASERDQDTSDGYDRPTASGVRGERTRL
jgi:hypothetical protein